MSHLSLTRVVAAFVLLSTAAGFAAKPVKGPRIDVVFAIDTTGSMGDEIDVVKQRLRAMVAEIGTGQPRPDVRFGLVAYKDRGDAYVTRPVELSRNVNAFYEQIQALSADGGGDEPEDVAAALTWAIDKMNWDSSREVAKLVFLIGDAGPHHYANEASMKTLAARAKEKRIKITAIGCSGLMGDAEQEFRTLALNSGGRFDVLTYRQVVAQRDGSKKTVLTRGGETVVAEGELDEREWKAGADKVVAKGKAERVSAGSGFGTSAVTGGGGLGGMPGRMAYGTRASAPAAPPPAVAPVTAGENNLDALITTEIKASAEAAGTSY